MYIEIVIKYKKKRIKTYDFVLPNPFNQVHAIPNNCDKLQMLQFIFAIKVLAKLSIDDKFEIIEEKYKT